MKKEKSLNCERYGEGPQQLEIYPVEQKERRGRQQIRGVAYVVGAVSLMNNAKSLSWWHTALVALLVVALAEGLARSPLAKFMAWMPKSLKKK